MNDLEKLKKTLDKQADDLHKICVIVQDLKDEMLVLKKECEYFKNQTRELHNELVVQNSMMERKG